jgi:hypothetical protein
MLTFQDQYQLYQQITGDYSSATLLIAKRDINEGAAMFMNRLGRKFNKEYQTASLTINVQYYQLPSEVLRVSEIRVLQGTTFYMPELVTSEEDWNNLNATTSTSTYPTHYYIRGFNEIGLFPIPSASVTGGLRISYEPQHVDLSQADYTTGTITVTNGAVAVTHSASGFTQQMVGRYLQVTDGTDGKWYRIGAFVSSSVVNLENYYEGIGGSGRTFKIGEITKIPNAYQDAPVYYALDRYYQTQNDQKTAQAYEARFDRKLKGAKQSYARSTSRIGSKITGGNSRPTAPFTDLNARITYP